MINKEKFLPIIFCIVLPGFSLLTSSSFNFLNEWSTISGIWFFSSVFLLFMWFLLEKLHNISTALKKWLSIFIICPLLVIAFSAIMQYLFNPPINVTGVSHILQFGFWGILASRLLFVIFFFSVIIQGIKINEERDKVIIENIILQSENLKAQLNLFRNHLNPHFLFNSLSTLQSMVRDKEAKSEEYILKLSDVYRQILQVRESPEISLEEELEFLKAYLYLLNIRHENALFIEIAIKEESLNYNLPVFALQLLIENCIKHNIVSELKPLKILISQSDEKHVTISNNYQARQTKGESFGMGIKYLTSCYEQLQIKDGIKIMQSETHYTTTLKLY